jgi:hypothetical protein
MSGAKKGLLIGCLIYGLAFLVLVGAHLFQHHDELIILGILGMPLNLLFFALTGPGWGVVPQTAVVGLLGLVQYGALGYLLGRQFARP